MSPDILIFDKDSFQIFFAHMFRTGFYIYFSRSFAVLKVSCIKQNHPLDSPTSISLGWPLLQNNHCILLYNVFDICPTVMLIYCVRGKCYAPKWTCGKRSKHLDVHHHLCLTYFMVFCIKSGLQTRRFLCSPCSLDNGNFNFGFANSKA